MEQQVQALRQTCAQLTQRIAALTGENPVRLLEAIGAQGQPGQPRQTGASGGRTDTLAQAYARAARLAEGAEQRRLERNSPM